MRKSPISWNDILFDDLTLSIESIADEDGGGYRAWVPDLGSAGLVGDGESPAEAIEMLKAELPAFLSAMEASGARVPELTRGDQDQYSGRILVRIPPSLHRQLAREAAQESMSLNSLVVALLASGCRWRRSEEQPNKSASRLTPRAWAPTYKLSTLAA
jgi:antitoxin HicB